MYDIEEYSSADVLELFAIERPDQMTDRHIDARIRDLLLQAPAANRLRLQVFLSKAREKALQYIRELETIEAEEAAEAEEAVAAGVPAEVALGGEGSAGVERNGGGGGGEDDGEAGDDESDGEAEEEDLFGFNALTLETNPILREKLVRLKREIAAQEKARLAGARALNTDTWRLTQEKASVDTLNPTMPRTFDRALNVDSRFRADYDTTQSNDFYVDLPDDFRNVVSMEVTSIEIPNNRYQIEEGLNSFTLHLSDSGGTTPYEIVLEPGNYGTSTDVVDFFTEEFTLGGVLIFATATADITDAPPPFRFHINERTGFTEISAYNPAAQVAIQFNPAPSNPHKDIGRLLGFTKKVYSPAAQHVSERIFQINGLSYFYLSIDDHNHNFIRTITNNVKATSVNENVISRFPLVANRFSGNLDEKRFSGSVGRKRIYNGPVDIHRLRIQLIDEFGEPLDIKNADWFITLLFRCKYTA